jgi:hypothetical protein
MISAFASAQDSAPATTPIETMIQCGLAGGVVEETLDARYAADPVDNRSHYDKANAAFQKVRNCLDDKVVTAISYAGDNSDLKNAIKDFYAKETAWSYAALPSLGEGQRVYEHALEAPTAAADESRAKLRLEAKLAKK